MAYQYGGGFAQDLNRTTTGTKLRNYGTTDVNEILRKQQEDAALVERNAAVMEQERKYAFEQATRKSETDELVRRNRLGLGTLSGMLNDRYSPAYEWSEGSGPAVNIQMGGLDGSAPPDMSPMAQSVPRERILRSEYQPAFDAQASSGSRTRTVEEMSAIEKAKADERLRVLEASMQGRSELANQNNTADIAMTQARLQASAPGNMGNINAIANDLPTSAGLTTARPPVKVEVSDDQVIDSDPTGTVVRGVDGRTYFLPKGTDNRIDITDKAGK